MEKFNIKHLRWCSNCLAMSTRPRISFDQRGFCNACQWMEKKSNMNWKPRQDQLKDLLDEHRSLNGEFDVLVPVSGGKDGSYVSYNLKHKYKMNPLCVTVTPPLSLNLGDENLRNFIESGYNHLSINVAYEALRKLNQRGLDLMGFPYFGWLMAMQAAPVRLASNLGIKLIFYGEDGEVEYGGSTQTDSNPIYDIEYMKTIYLENGYDKILHDIDGISQNDLNLFKFPSNEQINKSPVKITHWSYFENWDPYRNYLVAKEHCGLKESDETNAGTFTNYAQNDQALYALHTYFMYLKFGFGRANQDACIEIRRGAMDREQAMNLVRIYDGQYPEDYIKTYLDYYQMSQDQLEEIIDKWTNKNLFEKIDGRWEAKFTMV